MNWPIYSAVTSLLGDNTCHYIRELVKEKLDELGFQAVEFGLHSIRAGGTTAAAGVLIEYLKDMKLENAKDGYVEYSLE